MRPQTSALLSILFVTFWTQTHSWDPRLPLDGLPLPLPRKVDLSQVNRTVSKGSLTIDLASLSSCDILVFAKDTYENHWFVPTPVYDDQSEKISINVNVDQGCPGSNEFPQQNMVENYSLSIRESGDILLTAPQVWGVLRGLETISQLIFPADGKLYLRTGHINDGPQYPYRGLLIDTSRHFLTKNVILRQIDLLAQSKMNVLHWHVTDTESFPYVSRQFPELSAKGAFDPHYVYSQQDVKDIVAHARLRGVRVVAEFDTPGHMASWRGIPALMTQCGADESNVLDPSEEGNFDVLEQLFAEVHQVFPETLVHLGGDEISYFSECWLKSEKVSKFMEQRGWGKDVHKLVNYYFDRLQNIISKVFGSNNGDNIIFWEEVFQNNNPRNNSIVHVWYDPQLVLNATRAGHRTVVSQGWYLDHIKGGEDWSKMYARDPTELLETEAQRALVLGGEACMWGEFIDTTNIETTVWPRTFAVAERLWSNPPNGTDPKSAIPRTFAQRCRLLARGFMVRPDHGPDFCPTVIDFPYPAKS